VWVGSTKGLSTTVQKAQQRHNYAYLTVRDHKRGKRMRDDGDEVCNFNFDSSLEPHCRPLTFRDAVRHRHAVTMLARQIAFQEGGQQATANEFASYFKQHQRRLIATAKNVIASRPGYARWRFSRR